MCLSAFYFLFDVSPHKQAGVMFLHVLAGAVGRVNIFTVSSQGYTEALVLCEVCPPVPAFLLSAGKEM